MSRGAGLDGISAVRAVLTQDLLLGHVVSCAVDDFKKRHPRLGASAHGRCCAHMAGRTWLGIGLRRVKLGLCTSGSDL